VRRTRSTSREGSSYYFRSPEKGKDRKNKTEEEKIEEGKKAMSYYLQMQRLLNRQKRGTFEARTWA